ncbi:ankyrin repeat domain-containing protein [Echinicola sp. 20G]|uniref:ankyrin repeat domain-containing protein n=1 Tax=Echinicola sp. 20G TaxID=2781961 RepID=UPI0019101607|nr:ankyrin repeat domain-containing protein [Echinicola sp. 20G]
MKKLFTFVLAAGLWTGTFAQDKALVTREFWQGHPTLDEVKKEWDKGFSYSEVIGADDPLAFAVSNEAPIEVVKFLVNQPGVDLTRKLHEGRIYIHLSANSGHVSATEYLLEKGSPADFLDANGHTAFTFAGFQGNLTVPLAEAFLKHGVDVNERYPAKDGQTILLISVLYDKDLSLTDYFISKGASVQEVDDEGNTAFNLAARSGDVNLLKELLKRGVKYDGRALIMAAQATYRTSTNVDVHKYLVEDLGISPNQMTDKGENLLNLVTKKNDQSEAVAFYLSKGVDGANLDQDGNSPFLNAAGSRDFKVVTLLYPSVKDINLANQEGVTPLMAAVQRSTAQTVSFLLENGADVNISDAEGNTLLNGLAASFRVGGRGRGNADEAVEQFKEKLAVLKSSGLDLTVPDKDGNTLYHLLAEKNNVEILKAVADLNIDINATNKEGLTALHRAAMVSKDDKTLKYLVSIGAKKDIATDFDETAYTMAASNEQLKQNEISVEFLK